MSVLVGREVGTQVNKFEQVSSDVHQMFEAGAGPMSPVMTIAGGGEVGLTFQCIMGYGHAGTLPPLSSPVV